MRTLVFSAIVIGVLCSGQEAPAPVGPAKTVLENTGKPMQAPFRCTEEDLRAFDRNCTGNRPCPVYLELASVESAGNRIFAAGNLHSDSATLASILLASEDGGKTWTEPAERIRTASLDVIQFVDFENGWVSGQVNEAIVRDPFFLVTNDGGKTWRQRPVFPEPGPGAIEAFRFESKSAGTAWIDLGQSSETGNRYAVYESKSGGESWSVRQVSSKPLRPSSSPAAPAWRVRPDARIGAYHIEKHGAGGWTSVASFLIRTGECKEAEPVLPEPQPQEAAPKP